MADRARQKGIRRSQVLRCAGNRALGRAGLGPKWRDLDDFEFACELGNRLMVVTPGIRPVENKPVDDQKRTVDVAQAFRNGADYMVVGRPIRQAESPRQAALGKQQTIGELFSPADR